MPLSKLIIKQGNLLLQNQTSLRRKFEDIQVGDEAEFTHQITQDDVDAFTNLSGDYNPLHLNAEFARRANFRQPVVYGMLSASFISTMIGMLLPGEGALWMSQTLEFNHPAYVGDTLCIKAHVQQKSPATRTIVLKTTITNQHMQAIIVGESKVKLLRVENKEVSILETQTRTILVTGASRGIGAAVAKSLANNGHRVIVNYAHSHNKADAVVKQIQKDGGQAINFAADVADKDAVCAMLRQAEETLGPVTGLVHCAAPNTALQPFVKLAWSDMVSQLNVQVQGAFHCTQAILPSMLTAESGVIVFIGSIASDGAPPSQQTDYVVAKAALSTMARALAVELGPKHITINVVSPGMTQTARIVEMPEKARMLARMQTPLRQLGEPEDTAEVVSFLFSRAASHITGETIRVSGGAGMG